MTKYWSAYDNEMCRNVCSGKNSKTIKEAVEDVWEMWSGGSDVGEEDSKQMEKWGIKDKREWLENIGFHFFSHSKKIGDDE